jgi:hypothetical protein
MKFCASGSPIPLLSGAMVTDGGSGSRYDVGLRGAPADWAGSIWEGEASFCGDDQAVCQYRVTKTTSLAQ